MKLSVCLRPVGDESGGPFSLSSSLAAAASSCISSRNASSRTSLMYVLYIINRFIADDDGPTPVLLPKVS